VGGEGLREGIDPLRLYGETRGRAMPAPAAQVIGAGTECPVEVECRNGAARAGPVVLASRDEDHGTVKALDEPRGDDADHATVPVLTGHHVTSPAPLGLGPLAHLRKSFVEDPLLDGLPVTIQALELGREAFGLLPVVGEEKLQGGPGMA
jgi:hypothetical protein